MLFFYQSIQEKQNNKKIEFVDTAASFANYVTLCINTETSGWTACYRTKLSFMLRCTRKLIIIT
jgi:hypothetical protein